MSIIIKDGIVFNRYISEDEDAAVSNYLNTKWDVGLDERATPLVYDRDNHCFFEKELENENRNI